jgi:hypothetical protein
VTVGAVNCGNWEAYHDQRPPPPYTLIVTGQCDVPQGKTVELKRQVSPDSTAMILVLDVVVSGPAVPDGTPSSLQDVRYEEETDIEYEAVTIRLTVPVQDVS